MSDYQKKVQAGNFIFPNFSDNCPICQTKHCTVRIGYYYRRAIDIDLENNRIIIILIPVARYLCKSIKKTKYRHKTFSLLPDTLIPYNKISIDLMMYILQLFIFEKRSKHIFEKIDAITPGDIFFSEKMLHHILEIMEQSRIKLILFFRQYNTNRAPPKFHMYTLNETIRYILQYPTPYPEHPIRGAYHLSVLYYKMQGEYCKNARFLFGTASQF